MMVFDCRKDLAKKIPGIQSTTQLKVQAEVITVGDMKVRCFPTMN